MTAKDLLRKCLGLGSVDDEAQKILQERMKEFDDFWGILAQSNLAAHQSARNPYVDNWATFAFWLGPKVDEMIEQLAMAQRITWTHLPRISELLEEIAAQGRKKRK